MLLNNKTIIITGASSGIGAAAAHKFAEHGANVVLGARRGKRLEGLVEEIQGNGGKAVCLKGDVRNEIFSADLVRGILGELGPVPDMDTDNWANVISTNLDSVFYSAKHQIPAMRKTGGGSIVFTSSFVGHTVGLPGMTRN